jgi:Flp pilus assembly protein TadG
MVVATAIRRGAAGLSALRETAIRFRVDLAALSAVEFALVLPIMLTLYLGGVELSDALTINRKVTHVTSTLADLVAQSKTITDSDMEDIFDAAESIMTPYDITGMEMVVSGIAIDADGVATVAWSDTRGGTALVKDSTYTGLPVGVNQASTFLVMAKVNYDYTPIIGYVLTGTYDLHDQFYLRPRLSTSVARQ